MKKHLFLIALICSIFVACGPKPELPTVTTNSVSEVTDTTALCVGAVVNDGNADITAKGFCWSTEQNPTLENNTVMTVTTREDAADDFFTATLSGLTAATEYYVRAYATNSEGTAYGENVNFVTLEKENSDDNTGDDNTGDDNTGDDNTGDDNTGDDNTGDDNTGDDNTGDDNTGDDNTGDDNTGDDNTGDDNTGDNNTGDDNTGDDNTGDDNTGDDNTGDDNTGDDNTGDDNTGDDNDGEIIIATPTVLTSDVTEITETSAVISYEVTSDGGANVTSRGICWSTNENPTIEDTHTNDGEGIGVFTSTMTNLTPNTTYYVRAYATNSEGTSYGNEMNFTTLEEIVIELPTVLTSDVTEITETSAVISYEVTSDGGANVTSRGICWSTNENPTIEDTHTNDGEGMGVFTSTMTNLTPNTTYYVRAYATNSEGTSYGNEMNFTTLEEIILELPTITDVTISEVTSNTSIISAEVLTDGGAEVTERGFYWGEKSSVEPNRVNVGEGLGNFTYQLTGLNGGTEYYVYSFAKNSVGEVVGTIAYFTTIENLPEIEYVDMGFPSGVKWATCNFGATTPQGYGEYYAWGEIETKEEYTWQNGNCLTYGKELGDISGNPEYDVVAAKWGGNWRSPRLEDMYELVTLCDWIWNGKGFNVVSRINGSYIFLPAAGFMNTLAANAAGTEGALDQGVWGYYWTTTPYSEELEGGTNTNKKACFLTFSSGGYMTDQGGRFNGFSIRPVRD